MSTLHNILYDRSNSYQRDSRIVAGLENFEISQSRRSCRRFQRLFILLSREIFLLCNSLRFFLSREFRLSPFSLFRERESFFAGFQRVAKLASNPREKYRCGPPVGKLFHDTIRSRPQPSFEFLPAKTAHRRILEFLSRLITSPARKRHLPTILTNTLIVIVTRKRDLKDFHFRLFSSYFCVKRKIHLETSSPSTYGGKRLAGGRPGKSRKAFASRSLHRPVIVHRLAYG